MMEAIKVLAWVGVAFGVMQIVVHFMLRDEWKKHGLNPDGSKIDKDER